MLEQILKALFPKKAPSPGMRRLCTFAILLFPLALAAGIVLLYRNTPAPPVPVTTNLDSSMLTARRFLRTQGIATDGWTGSNNFNTDGNNIDFLNAKPERMKAWNVAPPVFGTVTLRGPQKGQTARVYLSVDGRVLGFDVEKAGLPNNKATLTDEAALQLAKTKLPRGLSFAEPGLVKNTVEGQEQRIYTFRSTAIPQAAISTDISVLGDRVVQIKSTLTPDKDEEEKAGDRVQAALNLAGFFFVCIVSIFSVYRYVNQMIQQEVSHSRSVVVALLCSVFCALIGLNAVVYNRSGDAPLAAIIAVFAILGILGGGLLAAAYGSGEGDVREAYPGKLTSLDTLLTGHIFSRNVGVAVLIGFVCSSWLLLAMGILTTPFRTTLPQGSNSMAGTLVRLGWLMPTVTYGLLALSFSAAGLLQPLAFAHRYLARWPRLRFPFLMICASLVSMLRVHARSTQEFLLGTVVFVAALLIPFFALDLFATLVCIGSLSAFMGIVNSLVAVPGFSGISVVIHAITAIVMFGFAIASIGKGRHYSDEQVRPLYARHIAQRKSLEAEVSAAREAQLRLLPESVPDYAGLHISAVCIPAETVGGDFYDFFPLGDGRLGIFIAEGNNRGLAAALTIALAKGYLMHCVERYREPVEILEHLETALASIFATGGSTTTGLTEFAFASVDPAAGEIRYARTGAYPKVVVVSGGGAVSMERMIPVRGRSSPIVEGRARLEPGDHVVLFTDGIGRRMAAGNRRPEDFVASMAARFSNAGRFDSKVLDGNPAEAFRDHCMEATKESLEPDDLTMVVLRVSTRAHAEGSAALGVVA